MGRERERERESESESERALSYWDTHAASPPRPLPSVQGAPGALRRIISRAGRSAKDEGASLSVTVTVDIMFTIMI